TVLGVLILLAHSLPVEQRIVQRAGGGFLLLTALRIVGGYLLAYIMFRIYAAADLLQEPVQIIYLPLPTSDTGWLSWVVESSKTLIVIFFIILGLIAILRLMDVLGITKFLTSFLAPVLSFMGISKLACNMTLSGALLGLAFGGALIIKETQSGNLSPKDIFLSLAFLCLCHGIIEDSIFVMALGADISGVLFARLIFTLVIMYLLGKIIHAIPDALFERYLFRTRY
ncbi:MAG: nucleoside recognition protein, partial [Methyloligellaceae bacterium]